MIRAIFGLLGHGKSTLARHLSRDAPRVLLYDPFDEHDAVQSAPPDFLAYLDRVKRAPRFRASVRPMIGDYGDDFCAAAWVLGQHAPVLAVIEEVDTICTANYIGRPMRQLISQGRHARVDILTTTRRPAEVNRLLTSMTEELFAFHTQEPLDLDYLGRLWGNRDLAAELAQLPRFAFIARKADGSVRRGRVTPDSIIFA